MKGSVNVSEKVFLLFNLFMIFLYAVAGIMLIFVWPPKEMLPEINRYGLGTVLFIYALYRSFRLYGKLTNTKSTVSSND